MKKSTKTTQNKLLSFVCFLAGMAITTILVLSLEFLKVHSTPCYIATGPLGAFSALLFDLKLSKAMRRPTQWTVSINGNRSAQGFILPIENIDDITMWGTTALQSQFNQAYFGRNTLFTEDQLREELGQRGILLPKKAIKHSTVS